MIPGHQRGVITFRNSTTISAENLPPCHRKSGPDEPASPGGKSGKCVICMMAAITPLPPAVDGVPQLSFRESLVTAQPESTFAPHVPLPFSERGPPTA